MECKVCMEHVTNPICPDCLGAGIEQWMREEAPHLVETLRTETSAIRGEGTKCIRCSEEFCVCTYCYTRQVFNMLREGDLQLAYVDYFNFDFYHGEPYGGKYKWIAKD